MNAMDATVKQVTDGGWAEQWLWLGFVSMCHMEAPSGSVLCENYTKYILLFCYPYTMINEDNRELGYSFT